MINTSHPQPEVSIELIDYLRQKLGLSENALNLGLRQAKQEQAPLPIVLWTFGLITLEQFQDVLDWQNNH